MRDHRTDYDLYATDRCERVLLTLLGDVGPWSERIYLAGGLAPRYLVYGFRGEVGHSSTSDQTRFSGRSARSSSLSLS